jgi:biopolymer transport protein ExbD
MLAGEILPEILKRFKENKTEVLFLRADFNLPYGKVAKLMSFLKRGGIHNISLVTVTEDKE